MVAWVLPSVPSAVRLMNTIWADRAGVHDDLASAEALRTWLSGVGLQVDHPTDDDLARAVLLRDAARTLAAVSASDRRPRAATSLTPNQALEALNTALRGAPAPSLTLHDRKVRYERPAPAPTTESALATLAAEAAELLGDVTLGLRACHAPRCVLYFVKDHPRRSWCSPACGNRARAARHYAKQKRFADNS